jgi:hypothetical protein
LWKRAFFEATWIAGRLPPLYGATPQKADMVFRTKFPFFFGGPVMAVGWKPDWIDKRSVLVPETERRDTAVHSHCGLPDGVNNLATAGKSVGWLAGIVV